MKMLRFGAIFALLAASTFGCSGDDDDDTMKAAAGAPSSDGAAGADGSAAGSASEAEGGAAPVDCDDGSQGGAGGAGPALGEGLEIIGTWTESFGGDLEITSTHWNDTTIEAYDNDANVVYTRTPCDAMYFPGNYSKYVYIEPTADSFYYCTIIYDAKTLAEAQASTQTADQDDLMMGCNGFPWSQVTKP